MNTEISSGKNLYEKRPFLQNKKVNKKRKYKMNETKKYEYGKQIVILQRGWIVVGDVTRVGDECEIDNAAVIRTWGTTKGLGEIAENGPTANTKLDPCPKVRFHYLTTIGMIECREDKWSK